MVDSRTSQLLVRQEGKRGRKGRGKIERGGTEGGGKISAALSPWEGTDEAPPREHRPESGGWRQVCPH